MVRAYASPPTSWPRCALNMTEADTDHGAHALNAEVVAVTCRSRGRRHNEDSVSAGPWLGPEDVVRPAVLRPGVGARRAAAFIPGLETLHACPARAALNAVGARLRAVRAAGAADNMSAPVFERT